MERTIGFVGTCALIVSSLGTVSAMNGRHVTVKGENLLLTTIQNNATSGSQSIACQARGPQFSFDGEKIAFWRNNGGTWHLSVMDASTRAITDLVDVSTWVGADAGSGGEIRWPAGPWIYLQKPSTTAIWRINSDDPAEKSLVADYSAYLDAEWEIYGFSLAADARTALVTFGAQYPWRSHQYIHNFPPTSSGPGAAPNFLFDLPNCNPALSPSSNWAERFWNGMHEEMIIYKWNETQNTYVEENGVGNCTNPNSPPTICVSTIKNIEPWSGETDWAEFFEGPNWAVNSDRWMTVAVLLPGTSWDATKGSNSAVVSWKDKKCINVTRNSMGTSSLGGSLFVEGGPAGCYQDIDGVWRDLSGSVAIADRPARDLGPGARIMIERRTLRIEMGIGGTVSVLDAHGRTIGSTAGMGANVHVFASKALESGIYFVKVRTGSRTHVASVVMQ